MSGTAPQHERGTPATTGAPRRSLWFNVGSFFGHVGRAIVADPARPRTASGPAASRTSSHQEAAASPIPGTRATLRRTTTEELFIEPLEDRTNQ